MTVNLETGDVGQAEDTLYGKKLAGSSIICQQDCPLRWGVRQ